MARHNKLMMTPQNVHSKDNRSIASLDGLRALSIILVLLGHLGGTQHFPHAFLFFETYANFGVRVFFVISGFLITQLLLKEHARTGRISLKDFYIRRFFRIFPAAYAYMLVISLVAAAALTKTDIAFAFAYLTNYRAHGPWLFGHLWSLAVEEQFYLLWPLAMVLAFRRRNAIACAAIVSGPLFRILFYAIGLRGAQNTYFPSVADALAMGCLLAIVRPELERRAAWLSKPWFAVVPIVALMLPLLPQFNVAAYQLLGLTVMHAAIALSIDNAIRFHYRILNTGAAVWLGRFSYSLYLWQEPFLNRNSANWWTAFPQNLLFAFCIALLSYYLIERPFLRLREKLHEPRHTPMIVASVAAGRI